jgi:hypothetical protein
LPGLQHHAAPLTCRRCSRLEETAQETDPGKPTGEDHQRSRHRLVVRWLNPLHHPLEWTEETLYAQFHFARWPPRWSTRCSTHARVVDAHPRAFPWRDRSTDRSMIRSQLLQPSAGCLAVDEKRGRSCLRSDNYFIPQLPKSVSTPRTNPLLAFRPF